MRRNDFYKQHEFEYRGMKFVIFLEPVEDKPVFKFIRCWCVTRNVKVLTNPGFCGYIYEYERFIKQDIDKWLKKAHNS